MIRSIIRPSLLLALASVAAPLLLSAQTAQLTVEAGSALAFDTRMSLTSVQTFMGQEVTMRFDADGRAELTPTSVAATRIDWTAGFPKLHMHAESAMLASGAYDSTLVITPAPMTTDRIGVVLSAPSIGSADAQVNMLLQQGLGPMWWREFFSPTLGAARAVGASWEAAIDDTVRSPETELVMRRTSTTRYTLEALVDTMGRHAMRVHAETTKLTVDGTMRPQGMAMSLTGDGATDGLLYYDADTGMLLAGVVDSEVAMTAALTGGAKMVVPVTVTTRYTMARVTQ
jgi:hypothetical protein